MMYYLIGCVYGLLVGACRRDSFLEASVSGPDVYHGDFSKYPRGTICIRLLQAEEGEVSRPERLPSVKSWDGGSQTIKSWVPFLMPLTFHTTPFLASVTF